MPGFFPVLRQVCRADGHDSADRLCRIGRRLGASATRLQPTAEDGRWLTAAEVECQHILRTLEHTGYNQSAAARLLGIDRHQLRRRMFEYGLMTPGQAKRGRPAASQGRVG